MIWLVTMRDCQRFFNFNLLGFGRSRSGLSHQLRGTTKLDNKKDVHKFKFKFFLHIKIQNNNNNNKIDLKFNHIIYVLLW